jgi:hypothetical protein
MVGMRGAELNTQRTAVEGFEDGIYKKILGLLNNFINGDRETLVRK